jgi:flavin reductase (DIM6/NTAB) family NADH-FMN oxidoreductase RutF
MEALLNDLAAHNLQNRTAAVIENGTWAAASGGLMREVLGKCKNIRLLDQTVSIQSALKADQLPELEGLADAISKELTPQTRGAERAEHAVSAASIDPAAMFKLSYGLFVLTAKDGAKDNGCVINTVAQITQTPLKITVTVNKANFTHDMIVKTQGFNLSVLTESVPFRVFEQFGFGSGRDADKFENRGYDDRTANGIRYIPDYTNCVISAEVTEMYDHGTHTVFVATVIQTLILSDQPSVTYQYYYDHIKPAPQPSVGEKKGYVCKICGYVYEGSPLPGDFICPLCKHGAVDFEPL